jgi:hypothetical protein
VAAPTSPAPTLPTWEEYEQATRRISLAIEEELEPLVVAVGRVTNYEGKLPDVDFADIGRLWSAIDYLKLSRHSLDDARLLKDCAVG